MAAPQRRFLGGHRERVADEQPEPTPVPTGRVTVAHAEPFPGEAEAEAWLRSLRRDRAAREAELDEGVALLNRILRAHRAATADPFVSELRSEQAVARRVGYGEGVAIAGGRLDGSLEAPFKPPRRPRAAAISPQERLAATLSGRAHVLVCEELVLRARLDLDAGHGREAALQARIALEALLVEVADASTAGARGELETERDALARAANAALDGDLDEPAQAVVRTAVDGMERVLARRRAAGI